MSRCPYVDSLQTLEDLKRQDFLWLWPLKGLLKSRQGTSGFSPTWKVLPVNFSHSVEMFVPLKKMSVIWRGLQRVHQSQSELNQVLSQCETKLETNQTKNNQHLYLVSAFSGKPADVVTFKVDYCYDKWWGHRVMGPLGDQKQSAESWYLCTKGSLTWSCSVLISQFWRTCFWLVWHLSDKSATWLQALKYKPETLPTFRV